MAGHRGRTEVVDMTWNLVGRGVPTAGLDVASGRRLDRADHESAGGRPNGRHGECTQVSLDPHIGHCPGGAGRAIP